MYRIVCIHHVHHLVHERGFTLCRDVCSSDVCKLCCRYCLCSQRHFVQGRQLSDCVDYSFLHLEAENVAETGSVFIRVIQGCRTIVAGCLTLQIAQSAGVMVTNTAALAVYRFCSGFWLLQQSMKLETHIMQPTSIQAKQHCSCSFCSISGGVMFYSHVEMAGPYGCILLLGGEPVGLRQLYVPFHQKVTSCTKVTGSLEKP